MINTQKLLALVGVLLPLSTGETMGSTAQNMDCPTARYVMATVANKLGVSVAQGSPAYACFPTKFPTPPSKGTITTRVYRPATFVINDACEALAPLLNAGIANLPGLSQQYTTIRAANTALTDQNGLITDCISQIKPYQSGLQQVRNQEDIIKQSVSIMASRVQWQLKTLSELQQQLAALTQTAAPVPTTNPPSQPAPIKPAAILPVPVVVPDTTTASATIGTAPAMPAPTISPVPTAPTTSSKWSSKLVAIYHYFYRYFWGTN